MRRSIFTGGLRTPFGRAFKGAYADVRADDLLVDLLRAQAKRFPDFVAHGIEDVIVGSAYPEGEQGYNVGRMAALGCGWDVPGMTVNRLCASSLEALSIGASRIASGWGNVYLAAGLESMSRVPRRGANFSESDDVKTRSPHAYVQMGETAEIVAREFRHITRTMQEDLAAASHERAFRAYERGDYSTQIHPFRVDRDEFVRFPVDRQKMASLPPAFDSAGIVTAATSSPLTDGATSGWVMEFETARRLNVARGLEIVDSCVAHVEPERMGLGPIPAIMKLFARHQLGPQDIVAYELNEAFAIQVLACAEELELPADRINAWGGAIAVGHPLGASGLRLVMTLHDRMVQLDCDNELGIASLCVGGGQGMAVLFRYRARI
jgi:acetyl-CoA acetyltransferase family protein